MADQMLDDLDQLPDGSLTQAEVRWLTAEIRRLRIVVALGIERIESHHPGAALTGLRAGLGESDSGRQDQP